MILEDYLNSITPDAAQKEALWDDHQKRIAHLERMHKLEQKEREVQE